MLIMQPAHDHIKITPWEREINHIATGMSPQPRGRLITHGHGDEELDGEVDEEVQPGEETAARSSHDAAAAARRGGGSPRWRPSGAAALDSPSSYLVMVQQWRSSSPSLAAAKRRKIRGFLVSPSKTRVSSLYIGGDNASRPSDGWPDRKIVV